MKILVVEDENSLADVMTRNLKARGYNVSVEETAEAALSSMARDWPDVVIIDINLPDYSGWEILRRLGEADRQRVKVIMTSAAPLSQRRLDEFKPAGALQKPFPISALLHAIEGSVESDSDEMPAVAGGQRLRTLQH